MISSFERWVSLGLHCTPKFQINRHVARTFLSLPENSAQLAHHALNQPGRHAAIAKINGRAQFFDWLVVEDYGKVAALMEAGFDYAFRIEDLEERRAPSGEVRSIACRRAGVRWEHLFRGPEALAAWREKVPEAAVKVGRLVEDFVDLRRYATLYVMTGDRTLLDGETVGRMHEALRRLRGGDAQRFGLLVCIADASAEVVVGESRPHDGLFVRHLDPTPDLPSAPWFGNSTAWDEAFADFRLVPTE